MICFDKVIAVLLGEMAGSGHQLVEHTRVGRCFVRRHRAGVDAVIESPGKEPASGRQVPLVRDQYVDDLAVLVTSRPSARRLSPTFRRQTTDHRERVGRVGPHRSAAE
jgi:hypothetical protein